MESLDSFNQRRAQDYVFSNTPRLNGIACPNCGEEMFDINPHVTLTSYPPKKDIGCKCGYKGYRIE